MSRGRENKEDLTRLEDLGHFEHLDDPELDKILNHALDRSDAEEESTEDSPPPLNLDELPEAEEETSDSPLSFEESPIEFQSPEETPSLPQAEENEGLEFQTQAEESTDSFEPTSENIAFQGESFSEESPLEFAQTEEPQEPQKEENQDELTQEYQTPFSNDEATQSFDTQTIFEEERTLYAPPSPALPPRKKPEDFQDLKSFAQNISYGKVSTGGNPPFSLILKGIRYQEDAREILEILEEHGLIGPGSQDPIRQGIKHGAVLISQISEYAAIYMAHKLRRFNIDIQVGLSEELHSSKSYESDTRGMIQRENILQNHSEHLDLEQSSAQLENIIMATTPTIQGYKIARYVEILTEQTIIDEDELLNIEKDSDQVKVFPELMRSLKEKALKIKCNAILGINFQFLPLPAGGKSGARIKVLCTGNAVILSNQ